MAAKADKFKTTLILEYSVGEDDKGKEIIKRQRFSSVKLEASDEELYAVANAFSPLLEGEFLFSKKQDDSLLLNI